MEERLREVERGLDRNTIMVKELKEDLDKVHVKQTEFTNNWGSFKSELQGGKKVIVWGMTALGALWVFFTWVWDKLWHQ